MYCSKCGFLNNNGEKYCKNCGKRDHLFYYLRDRTELRLDWTVHESESELMNGPFWSFQTHLAIIFCEVSSS